VELERLAENRRRWQKVEHELTDVIPLTSEVRFRFMASDEGGEDIVEAALDDVSVRAFQDPTTLIDPTSPPDAPTLARLASVVPNPYGAFGTIRLSVPSPPRRVTLRIYDVSGRLVKTLLDERALAGVRAVLECAGIKNILSKSLGTSNPHNQVGATINALERLEDPLEVAKRRGVPVRKVFEG